MADERGNRIVQPLAKVSKKQKVYKRPPAVEEEIEATLALPLHDAFRLAASGHTRPQTLVHLIRNFRPNQPTPQYSTMVVAFFSRLERAGDRILRDLPENLRERAHDDVQDRALELIAANDLDIFECSFKLGAERLYLTARAKMKLRMRTEISREDMTAPDSDVSTEEIADALAARAGRAGTPLAEIKAELNSIFALLTEEERIAVGHHLLMGLTFEETAAAMGCSDTKVKYIIKNARAKARETRA
ncbi:sigma factor-like helix-turn-helix DNA-binding protein [Sphingobium sp. R-7]|uniref:sigma factor-like helix-turn-helix DNA-binding protein n=1 Tax=Sphingobium sp. R-7 TaxID=3375449 RepID=UPI00398BBA8A